MPIFEFQNPVYSTSLMALLALAVVGVYEVVVIWNHKRLVNKGHQVVLKLTPSKLGQDLNDFVKSIPTPFALEISVHQLGKSKNYYLVLPKRHAAKLAGLQGIEGVAEDYHIFHSGGAHLGAYFKGSEEWPNLDLSKVNFSKIDEVGEGVTVQMIINNKKRKSVRANMRVAVSAPSTSQAKEIIAGIKKSVPTMTAIDSSSDEFMHRVNFREFSSEESMSWQLAG